MTRLIERETAQAEDQSTESKTNVVVMTPVSLMQAARTVKQVFFSNWRDGHRWNLELGRDNPWVFCCDRRHNRIIFTQRHFADREELRAALVLQMTLAWDIDAPSDAVNEKLDDACLVAESLNRPLLLSYLKKVKRLAASGNLDMLYDRVDNVVRTYNWLTPPDAEMLNTPDLDPMFEDSLHFTQIGERLKKEQAYLKLLQENLRKHAK